MQLSLKNEQPNNDDFFDITRAKYRHNRELKEQSSFILKHTAKFANSG